MLSVLDGAVLVISAVEGVQAQTRVLMRALQRLRVPTLLFVNKIDRRGARGRARAAGDRREADAGDRRDGTRARSSARATRASRRTARRTRASASARRRARRARRCAPGRVRRGRGEPLVRDCSATELAAQTRRALVHPVFFGSAITGAGVDSLMAGIAELLPAAAGDADGPVSGTVFKVDRGAGRREDRVRPHVLGHRADARSPAVRPGRRAEGDRDQRLRPRLGRRSVRRSPPARSGSSGASATSGSATRSATRRSSADDHHFAPPTLETVVVPRHADDKGALRVALAQLAEQDPLINVRQDDARQELSVSLYGEVQKEVIQATLATDFGLDVGFRETTTICVERPAGTGEAVEVLRRSVQPVPRHGRAARRAGRRRTPASSSGSEVEPRPMPLYVYKTVDASRSTWTSTSARRYGRASSAGRSPTASSR